MADARIICDRNILYDEVWAEPMSKVAKRYGVSDVALAKTCRKLGVPVPGRGYWTRVKAGTAEARPSLPALQASQRERTVLHPVERPTPPPWLAAVDDAALVQIAEPITVTSSLKNPHKLVVLSARYLMKAHPSHGLVSVSGRSCLGIQVAPESVDRALRIFDALIKAIEAAGLKVEIAVVEEAEPERQSDYRQLDRTPHPPARVTRVLCDDESIEFCLSEAVRRVEAPRTQRPRRGEHVGEPRVFAYEPTGELMLQLSNTAGLGLRSKWQDGKRQRLEDCLGDFIGHLSRVALALKLQRQAAEQRAIDEREAERRRLDEAIKRREAEVLRREEERRGERLVAEVALWRRAQDIRSYVQAAMEGMGEVNPGSESDRLARERWRWALEYADRIDPLHRGKGLPEDASC